MQIEIEISPFRYAPPAGRLAGSKWQKLMIVYWLLFIEKDFSIQQILRYTPKFITRDDKIANCNCQLQLLTDNWLLLIANWNNLPGFKVDLKMIGR